MSGEMSDDAPGLGTAWGTLPLRRALSVARVVDWATGANDRTERWRLLLSIKKGQ
jgi:hypothetical protein